ncbi:bifunctional riboflavin kinase/FAD synthetase [Lederbergia lenta]|uniref:Riboflavin biosynthesis protein n=1 Tax=Lederbergia lenta TaxID=1467 RepID=A0A2X4WBV2_LEDLE|nr:bifunctional riboflavin kinase/FAD synthetase [Lederbergia lenta]MEC2324324.1 bifunctional riboflavin kinase/FAD synthetase [Lederbergia lenta]SQI60179.1 riboflavin biosynthesis protein C, C-terminal part [Lederbergia lenta]
MNVIMIHHPQVNNKEDFPALSIALGFFDGVHRGHKEVITTAKNIAKQNGWKSAVMTFDPHPSVVLGKKNTSIQYITPLQDKIDLVEELGIDYLFIIRFTSAFASLSPQQFVDDYLAELNVKHVVAGFDYSYGKFGKGTMETLPTHARGRFDVTTVDKLEDKQEKVSSTAIRKLLSEGSMIEAKELIGRFYTTKGTVIHGEKRGRTIGFPTANIQLHNDYIIPKTGVYAVQLLVAGSWQEGVCNVGYKPTFKDPSKSNLSIEVHILNFDQSIYGEEIELKWHIRIRDEQKFNGIDELKAQIAKDKITAIDYFHSIDK